MMISDSGLLFWPSCMFFGVNVYAAGALLTASRYLSVSRETANPRT